MKKIAISEFKAKCLAIVEEVQLTKRPVCITRRGEPVAEIVPIAPVQGRGTWLGSMKDRMEIVGDIVSSATAARDWEALQE